MKHRWLIFMMMALLPAAAASAATVSCEVRSVDGGTLVLVNCDQKRLHGFSPGARVKVKLDRKKKKGVLKN